MHINQFPQETQDFIHDLIATALLRAIKNGTYKIPEPVQDPETVDDDSLRVIPDKLNNRKG
ncbi:hypothetical protein [Paenibacillus lemnae]|uniref:Uncharacterized protein n=1 Tax=Paenibacillus lemnae TaxID=1330551 RepID=A0A848MB15_PAELE|nr:hypothetical protein [Paenibacillus lemnae]NMO97449.1 hypothetical protein [Paenibacillus lemnae]